MKKRLFFLLVIPFLISASPLQQKHLAVISALNSSSLVHDCSGDQKFGWSAESITITDGSPAGCTDGSATTVTLGSTTLNSASAIDGTYDLLFGQSQLATIANFDNDEFNPADFKIEYIGTITTWATGARLLMIKNASDGDNYIYIGVYGSATDIEFRTYWNGNATTDFTTVTNANWDEGDSFKITVRGKPGQGAATDDFELAVCEVNPTTLAESNCETDTNQDDLQSWVLATDTIYLGESAGAAQTARMGRIKIFGTSGF